jgi:hypothetical protein
MLPDTHGIRDNNKKLPLLNYPWTSNLRIESCLSHVPRLERGAMYITTPTTEHLGTPRMYFQGRKRIIYIIAIINMKLLPNHGEGRKKYLWGTEGGEQTVAVALFPTMTPTLVNAVSFQP